MDIQEQQVRVLREMMAPLCAPLHESLDRGMDIAEGHFAGHDMGGPEYGSGIAHLARAHAYRLMRGAQSKGHLEDWKVNQPKGNLQLRMSLDGASLRMLRPVGDEPPPPGPNRARIAAWHGNMLGLAGSTFLGLWQRAGDTGEIEVRIVRPAGAWKLGRRSKIDIDFLLPREADDLASYEFRPTDEDMDMVLPFEDLPGGEDSGAGHLPD